MVWSGWGCGLPSRRWGVGLYAPPRAAARGPPVICGLAEGGGLACGTREPAGLCEIFWNFGIFRKKKIAKNSKIFSKKLKKNTKKLKKKGYCRGCRTRACPLWRPPPVRGSLGRGRAGLRRVAPGRGPGPAEGGRGATTPSVIPGSHPQPHPVSRPHLRPPPPPEQQNMWCCADRVSPEGRAKAQGRIRTRLATSVCRLRHDRMQQGPTEPHAGRGTFLLSSGGAGGGVWAVVLAV